MIRRSAGAVERDGLENRCVLTGTVGSNPTSSAANKVSEEGEASQFLGRLGMRNLKDFVVQVYSRADRLKKR